MNLQKIQIESERLLLVPVAMEYKEVIFREFQEPVTKFMHPKPPEKIEETERFIENSIDQMKNGTSLQMVIINKSTHEFLGCAGLHELKKKQLELGIWIKQSAHGHKYGREAMIAVKKWADEHIDYDYIRYPVVDQNVASRKIAESLGGKIARKYEDLTLSGRSYHFVEYRIPKKY